MYLDVRLMYSRILDVYLFAAIVLMYCHSCVHSQNCEDLNPGDKAGCKCRSESSSNFVVDLSNLNSNKPLTVDGTDIDSKPVQYSYQPCTPSMTGDCAGATVCQKAADEHLYICGKLPGTFKGDPATSNLMLRYTVDDNTRETNVYLSCGTEDKLTNGTEYERNKYNLRVTTSLVCKPSSGGLSTGSILLIIFFVLLIVYFVGGILILHFVRGARGIEQIPNYEFWKGLPGAIKDGVLFTSSGCKVDRTYDQI